MFTCCNGRVYWSVAARVAPVEDCRDWEEVGDGARFEDCSHFLVSVQFAPPPRCRPLAVSNLFDLTSTSELTGECHRRHLVCRQADRQTGRKEGRQAGRFN